MDVERWRRIEELLYAALECDGGERAAFIERVCGGDADLRREVESLLAHEAPSESFIEDSAFALAAEILADDAEAERERWEGRQVGAYRIVREIGRGGMGAVFLAERVGDEFRQQVALKVVRRSLADTELVRRFRRERQILATLNHPNIAHLLDGGVSEDGEPFLAMEYVEGTRIDDYCASHDLSIDGRLRLFLSVCRGVAYAHSHLVVHRDLKPSNIIVKEDGTPKLLDFGIAKLLDVEQAGERTQTVLRAFTLEYASPEHSVVPRREVRPSQPHRRHGRRHRSVDARRGPVGYAASEPQRTARANQRGGRQRLLAEDAALDQPRREGRGRARRR